MRVEAEPQLLDRVAASAGGRRLLALVADPHAEKGRRRQRSGRIDGSLGERVQLAGDALVDILAGREPRVWTLVADDPRQVGGELRRRMRGQVSRRFVQEAVHLSAYEHAFELRVLDDAWAGPLADPVLSLRAATLVLDGERAGSLAGGRPDAVADLHAGVLRLTDPDALRRRPEAVVTVARLVARPELRLPDATRDAVRAALADGALTAARQSRFWFALPDLLDAPEAIEALELLRDLSAPAPLHENAEVDGALLRRTERLLRRGASRPLALILAVARSATRARVRSFVHLGVELDFAGTEARAVIAAAGRERRPRWA